MTTTSTDRSPGWFRLSPEHFAALVDALTTHGVPIPLDADPRADPQAVRVIVDSVGSALAASGFTRGGDLTPAGRLFEDLIDYFVSSHPDYGDDAG
jgi:hypothetical protein